jgi:hypothetical protein
MAALGRDTWRHSKLRLTRPQLLDMLGGAATESVRFGGELEAFAVIAAFTD